jgi:hypothetical protein
MTPLAVLFMITAVGGVTLLCAWCYYRVLSWNSRSRLDDSNNAKK